MKKRAPAAPSISSPQEENGSDGQRWRWGGGCTLGCWLGPLGGTYDEEDGHGEYSSLNCQFKLSGARSERGDGLNCCEGLNRIECGSRVVQ